MLAVSPQFSSFGWLLDDPTFNHEQENLSYFSRERAETSESVDLHSPSFKNQPKSCDFGSDGGGEKTVKKLNHNASERDRRKKMNTLYADLRSLLPPQDHSKKLSIPVTVSRVLKYIPELQKEVERLTQKKERLMTSSSSNSSLHEFKNQRVKPTQNSYSATRISDSEVIIQISMPKSEKGSFSEAIFRLEEQGLLMVNASCFQSFEGRLFYNLHLQAEEGQIIDAEKLKEKAWPYI